MTEITKSSTMHKIAMGASAVAFLSFFLPFIQVDFFVQLSLSGIELIIKAFELEVDKAGILVLSPVFCVVGIICSIMAIKQSKAAIGTIVASAIGMIIMYAVMSSSDFEVINYIDYAAWGFYLYEIMSLVAVVVSFPIMQMDAGSSEKKEKIKLNFPTISIPKPPVKPAVKPTTPAKNACPNCKKVIGENVKFCRYCGASLGKPQTIIYDPIEPNPKPEPPVKPVNPSKKDRKVICPKCGARHVEGTATCKYCGTAINAASVPVSPEPPSHQDKTAPKDKPDRKAVCPHCGARQSVDVVKCKYCGTPMK